MATPLERAFKTLHAVAQFGVIVVGVLFFAYLIGGGLGQFLGLLSFQYAFLGLDTDPVFNLLTSFLSIFLIVHGVSLATLTRYLAPEKRESNAVIILCAVTIGFGTAALSATYSTTVNTIEGVIVSLT